MTLEQHDLALMTARFGAARFGATRFGFIPCPEDVVGPPDPDPGLYVWREQTPESQIVDTPWVIQNEDCSCRDLCTLSLDALFTNPSPPTVGASTTLTVFLSGVLGLVEGVIRIHWGDGQHDEYEVGTLTNSVLIPAHYWPLDESNPTREDLVGGWNLSPSAGTISSDVGIIGSAAKFVATDNRDLRTAVPITLPESFTLSFWYNATAATQSFAALFAVASVWSNDLQLVIYRTGVNNLIARISDGVTGVEVIHGPGAGFGTDHWVNVMVTYDADTKIATLYVNTLGTFDEAGSSTVALAGPRSDGPDTLYVGSAGGLYANDNYDGLIDDIRIYSEVLTSQVRRLIYDGGAPTAVSLDEGTLQYNHIYDAAGSYTISVDITDERGCRTEQTLAITVGAEVVGVYFTWNQNAESSTVSFTAHYGVLNVLTFDWDFGEGGGYELDVGDPINNIYGGSGEDDTYLVKLRVNAVEGVFEDTFLMTTNWAAGQSGSSQ